MARWKISVPLFSKQQSRSWRAAQLSTGESCCVCLNYTTLPSLLLKPISVHLLFHSPCNILPLSLWDSHMNMWSPSARFPSFSYLFLPPCVTHGLVSLSFPHLVLPEPEGGQCVRPAWTWTLVLTGALVLMPDFSTGTMLLTLSTCKDSYWEIIPIHSGSSLR